MMTKNKSKWWAKYKLIIALPVLVFALLAFSNNDKNLPDKSGNKGLVMHGEPEGMVFIPQGSFEMDRNDGQSTTKFNIAVDAFWMKETEVSIREYNEYLTSLKKDSITEVYSSALPDYSKAPYEDYFTARKYENYPVVGISLPQAKRYCVWKTNIENTGLGNQGMEQVRDYRIPREEEWIYASFGGMDPGEIIKPQISQLSKTGSKNPNDFGLFNMFDNVSEWTANILNPSIRITRDQNNGNRPIVQKRDVSDSASNWYSVDVEPGQLRNYLDSLNMHTGRTIVKGNSFRNLAIDENQVLESSVSYDYVGFRYVRSYTGRR